MSSFYETCMTTSRKLTRRPSLSALIRALNPEETSPRLVSNLPAGGETRVLKRVYLKKQNETKQNNKQTKKQNKQQQPQQKITKTFSQN